MTDLIYCAWGCGRHLRIRRGGSSVRFCSSRCRSAFWSACRRWGEQAIAAGIISIDDLKSADKTACTLRGEPSAHFDDADDLAPAKHVSQASPLRLNDVDVGLAERVFLCNDPGEPTVAVVFYSSDGTATMANLDRNRARRLGRGLLDAAAKR